jgi:hypothetical protein
LLGLSCGGDQQKGWETIEAKLDEREIHLLKCGNEPKRERRPEDPELAKRRAIARNHPEASAEAMVIIWDSEHIDVPLDWYVKYDLKGREKPSDKGLWKQAWAHRPLRPNIRSMVSKDRKLK